jgi:hypothetical protein
MDFGTLAGNDSINSRIHEMLDTLHPEDVPRFVRKFRRDPDELCFHTYRELILGAHLRACGWNLRYEQSLSGKTPDWVLDRLFAKLREKAKAYSSLAEELHLPYVVALFGEFTAPIEHYEVHHVLHELHGGVFAAVPGVAGTIFFRERHGQYEYHHFTNSHATLRSQIIRGS